MKASLGMVLLRLWLQGCGVPAGVTAPRFGVPATQSIENHEGSFTTNYYGSFTDNYYITVDYDNTNLTLSSTPHVHVRLCTYTLLHHHYYTTTSPPLHHHYIAGATTPTRARELELGPTRTLRGGRRHHNPTSTRQSFPCLVRSK